MIEIVPFILIAVGYFCLGGLWQLRKVRYWRIKWIEMEHDLARLQNREPRHISEVEGKKKS